MLVASAPAAAPAPPPARLPSDDDAAPSPAAPSAAPSRPAAAPACGACLACKTSAALRAKASSAPIMRLLSPVTAVHRPPLSTSTLVLATSSTL